MRITRSFTLVALRLALAVAGTAMFAPFSSIASAQTPSLPQIRLDGENWNVEAGNMYVCSGSEWEKCKTNMDAKIEDMFYSYPERDNLGGAQVRAFQTFDLGGVPAFVLYVRYFDLNGASWVPYQVTVTSQPVQVTSPYSGTLRATGAWAPLNGATVAQGEPLFEIITSPAVVNLNLPLLTARAQQPGGPGIALSVTTYQPGSRFGPGRP